MGMVYKSRLRVEFHLREEEMPMAHGTYLNKPFSPYPSYWLRCNRYFISWIVIHTSPLLYACELKFSWVFLLSNILTITSLPGCTPKPQHSLCMSLYIYLWLGQSILRLVIIDIYFFPAKWIAVLSSISYRQVSRASWQSGCLILPKIAGNMAVGFASLNLAIRA